MWSHTSTEASTESPKPGGQAPSKEQSVSRKSPAAGTDALQMSTLISLCRKPGMVMGVDYGDRRLMLLGEPRSRQGRSADFLEGLLTLEENSRQRSWFCNAAT